MPVAATQSRAPRYGADGPQPQEQTALPLLSPPALLGRAVKPCPDTAPARGSAGAALMAGTGRVAAVSPGSPPRTVSQAPRVGAVTERIIDVHLGAAVHKRLWGALDFAPRNPSEVEAADPSLVTNRFAALLPAQQTRCLSPQTGSPWHLPCLYPGGLWSEPAAP